MSKIAIAANFLQSNEHNEADTCFDFAEYHVSLCKLPHPPP